MKTTKLPKRLKKALKKAILKPSGRTWKTSEIRIYGIRTTNKKSSMPRVGNKVVSNYTMG